MPLGQQPLGRCAEIDVRTVQPLHQLLITFQGKVEPARGTIVVAMTHAIEPAKRLAGAAGPAQHVVIAMPAIVPVEDVEQAIGPGQHGDGREPGIARGNEIVGRHLLVGRAVALEPVDVDLVAGDVAHEELFAVLRRIGVAVEEVQAAVGVAAVALANNRAQLPAIGRRGARNPAIDARLGHVPQVVGDAGAHKGVALGVPGETPGVAGALGEHLEGPRSRLDAEDGTTEVEHLALLDYVVAAPHAAQAVEPAVGTPAQGIGQPIGVLLAKAGHDDLGLAGHPVAEWDEEDIRGVGDPDAAVADRDSGRHLQRSRKGGNLVEGAVALAAFQDLDAAGRPGRGIGGTGRTFDDPQPAAFIEGHRHGVGDGWLAGDQLDGECPPGPSEPRPFGRATAPGFSRTSRRSG